MSTPGIEIVAPSLPLAHGGLLSVATIIDAGDPHAANGFFYIPESCGAASIDVDRCAPPSSTVVITVEADGDSSLTISEAPDGETLTVNWGDETANSTGSQSAVNPVGPLTVTHTYADPGEYVVTVSGATYPTTSLTVRVIDGETGVASSTDKVREGADVLSAAPFTVYKSLECDLFSAAATEARTSRGLVLGEARAVETMVWAEMLAQTSSVDLTPGGGAVTIKAALGVLEGYAGENYGAVPTLHIPRSVVPLLTDLQWLDGALVTVQGSKIANGGGYTSNVGPDGNVAAAGEAWLYVSGEVTLTRTSISTYSAPLMVVNRARALSERVYAASVECFVAAVRVNLAGV